MLSNTQTIGALKYTEIIICSQVCMNQLLFVVIELLGGTL